MKSRKRKLSQKSQKSKAQPQQKKRKIQLSTKKTNNNNSNNSNNKSNNTTNSSTSTSSSTSSTSSSSSSHIGQQQLFQRTKKRKKTNNNNNNHTKKKKPKSAESNVQQNQYKPPPQKSVEEKKSERNTYNEIFVGNLPNKYSKEEMIEKLKNIFNKFGEIKDISVIPQKQNRIKGFGFITYSNHNEVVRAIEMNKNLMIDNKPIFLESKEFRLTNRTEKDIENHEQILFRATKLIIPKFSKDKFAPISILRGLKFQNQNRRLRKVNKFIKKRHKNWDTYFITEPFCQIFQTTIIEGVLMVKINSEITDQQIIDLLK